MWNMIVAVMLLAPGPADRERPPPFVLPWAKEGRHGFLIRVVPGRSLAERPIESHA